MADSDFALIAIAIITVGTFFLLPRYNRHYAILVPLGIVLLLAILNLFRVFGFSFKLVFLVLLGALAVAARVLVGRRM